MTRRRGGFAAFAVSYVIGELRREAGLSGAVGANAHSRTRAIMDKAPQLIATELANGDTPRQAMETAAARFGSTVGKVEAALAARQVAFALEEDIPEAARHEWADERRDILEDAMSGLSDVERIVIRERHLRADPATVYETGEKAGLSFQSVSRVAKRALAKMRAQLEARGLNADDVLA